MLVIKVEHASLAKHVEKTSLGNCMYVNCDMKTWKVKSKHNILVQASTEPYLALNSVKGLNVQALLYSRGEQERKKGYNHGTRQETFLENRIIPFV